MEIFVGAAAQGPPPQNASIGDWRAYYSPSFPCGSSSGRGGFAIRSWK